MQHLGRHTGHLLRNVQTEHGIGLGSDTINVTGDVTEDIVTNELEGLSGSVDHWVTSEDGDYDGLPVDGIELNVATPDAGQIIISETDGFTAVREEGLPGLFGTTPTVDRYSVKLAPGSYDGDPVYVTVSAARSPQEEADDELGCVASSCP